MLIVLSWALPSQCLHPRLFLSHAHKHHILNSHHILTMSLTFFSPFLCILVFAPLLSHFVGSLVLVVFISLLAYSSNHNQAPVLTTSPFLTLISFMSSFRLCPFIHFSIPFCVCYFCTLALGPSCCPPVPFLTPSFFFFALLHSYLLLSSTLTFLPPIPLFSTFIPVTAALSRLHLFFVLPPSPSDSSPRPLSISRLDLVP